uniref:Neprosin PEP catalytic domain-containing protein n=1 Tax=Oryza sativa subsp. japonica TaxID=39947 RepID=Q75IE7_ORYSJ|nr:hypothetical protein [Oryza sativa Japonica Group]
MGYRGPTAKIFILLSLLSLTFSAEPRKEEFVNHSVVKMFQMQPGSFPYSTNDAKGSKIYISSIDMCKIECPYGTMAAVETEPSTFYGSQSSISVWEPYLCTGRPPRYTGAVVVIQNGQSRIGAGWYVDPDMYGDNHAHFEIAWTNKDKSCTNLRCAGFIQLSNRIVPGAVLKPISTIDGKKYLIIISIFKIWDVWVLLFGEELVGYWPGELFTDLSGAANMIGWMGVASAATGALVPHGSEGVRGVDQQALVFCPIDESKGKAKVEVKGSGDGLGFFHIPLSAGQKIKHEPRAALIKVSKGQMTVNAVISELERLIPGGWRWVVHDNGNGSFRTIFPSAAELKRMVEWGKVHTKVGDAEMQIVERGVGNEVKYVIPKVWVQCKGIPSELREYLIIWAVGSILGITKTVDMVFTRRYDIARLQVLVLDPSLIPEVVDVVIGDYLYELAFRVEPENGPEEPIPMDMDNIGDGDFEKKNDGNEKGDSGKEPGPGGSSQSKLGSGSMFYEKGGPSLHSIQVGLTADSGGLNLSDEEFDGLHDDVIGVERVQSQESLVAKLSAIPEAAVSPSRRSKRRASDSDQLVLQRAEKSKADKNLENLHVKDDVINDLRSMEENRLSDHVRLSTTKGFSNNVDGDLVDDHFDDNFLLQHLCSEIMEEVMDSEHQLDFIALSETVKKDFAPGTLKNLCAGKDFLWHCKAPSGRSGGLLLGINLLNFDVGLIDEGDFYVKFHLCNRADKFKWALVLVYGLAQNENKDKFLAELVNMCSRETLPILIGGDFNILRSPNEKSNSNFDDRWPFLFNAIIDGLCLMELQMSGRNFTWANNLANPTYEKLDRVLMSTEWEHNFPLASVVALNRDISNHTPLLLNTNSSSQSNAQPCFKFELGWLLREGFVDMDGDQIINGDANLKAHITTFYKGLFSPPEDSSLQFDENRIVDVPQVSQLENEALTQPFSEKEIKEAVF